MNTPRLLVLDEPTAGLDPIARADVWQYIEKPRAGNGMTVLMTTHHMEEAVLYSDRLALMHQGTIRATGTPAAAPRDALGPDATLDDVFLHHTRGSLGSDTAKGRLRDVRSARRTARRLG